MTMRRRLVIFFFTCFAAATSLYLVFCYPLLFSFLCLCCIASLGAKVVLGGFWRWAKEDPDEDLIVEVERYIQNNPIVEETMNQ